MQHSVNSASYTKFVFKRLKMNITGPHSNSLVNNQVYQPNNRPFISIILALLLDRLLRDWHDLRDLGWFEHYAAWVNRVMPFANGVAVSPDGQHVYVTGSSDGAVAWFTSLAGGFLRWEDERTAALIPELAGGPAEPILPEEPEPRNAVEVDCPDWPFDDAEARRRQGKILHRCAKLVTDFKLKPTITDVLPLRDAAVAHRMIEEGHTQGKIVLSI